VLLAIQPLIVNQTSANAEAALWLYRRSDVDTDALPATWFDYDGEWQQDSGVIDYTRGRIRENGTASEYKVYPYPIVLIRPPAVIYSLSSINFKLCLGLWYVIQTVTDREMTELMMKDHA
jgi:hypothetical protein